MVKFYDWTVAVIPFAKVEESVHMASQMGQISLAQCTLKVSFGYLAAYACVPFVCPQFTSPLRSYLTLITITVFKINASLGCCSFLCSAKRVPANSVINT